MILTECPRTRVTVHAKAKELRRYADRMVTLGKRGDLAARRLAFDFMQSHDAVKRLFDEIAPRFKERNGGYTRVVKFGFRRGDAAPLSIIEFSDYSDQGTSRKPRCMTRATASSERRNSLL